MRAGWNNEIANYLGHRIGQPNDATRTTKTNQVSFFTLTQKYNISDNSGPLDEGLYNRDRTVVIQDIISERGESEADDDTNHHQDNMLNDANATIPVNHHAGTELGPEDA